MHDSGKPEGREFALRLFDEFRRTREVPLEVERVDETAHPRVERRLAEQHAGAPQPEEDRVGGPSTLEYIPDGDSKLVVLPDEQQ